jgi:hypothetical protein
MDTERLVIAVKPDLKKRFRNATREQGSNMTAEVNRFIRNYINKQSEKEQHNEG